MLKNKRLARRINLYTIIAVYFLILVGGIVRSMGAGMGCPDWPKCFGGIIPPASEAALPDNYEDLYVETRVAKNERLSSTLEMLGFDELADRVENDPAILDKTYYDPEKAWIEYINRLIGVIIGFLIILNMVFAFSYSKQTPWVVTLGILSFILVLFQGWVGSLVVSTNLLPGFISFHMVLALLLVGLLLIQRYQMKGEENLKGHRWLVTILLVMFSLQIFLGIQVRENVDVLVAQGVEKGGIIDLLGSIFYIHRSYSLLLVGLVAYLLYQYHKSDQLSALPLALGGVILLEILMGVILAYLGMPAFAQPVHLFLGTLAYGLLFYLFLQSNFKKRLA